MTFSWRSLRHRAKADLDAFASERGLRIAAYYVENESGANLHRPELFRLLSDCHGGDILLIEQVDRLSRLNAEDWESLKRELQVRKVRVVALDLPTSWMMTGATDEITARMMDALNGMMLDLLAAIARKDYTDRRMRQQQGIEKIKAEGGYKGRKEDVARYNAIMNMLRRGDSWNQVVSATGCSRSTLARLAQRVRESAIRTTQGNQIGTSFSSLPEVPPRGVRSDVDFKKGLKGKLLMLLLAFHRTSLFFQSASRSRDRRIHSSAITLWMFSSPAPNSTISF